MLALNKKAVWGKDLLLAFFFNLNNFFDIVRILSPFVFKQFKLHDKDAEKETNFFKLRTDSYFSYFYILIAQAI